MGAAAKGSARDVFSQFISTIDDANLAAIRKNRRPGTTLPEEPPTVNIGHLQGHHAAGLPGIAGRDGAGRRRGELWLLENTWRLDGEARSVVKEPATVMESDGDGMKYTGKGSESDRRRR